MPVNLPAWLTTLLGREPSPPRRSKAAQHEIDRTRRSLQDLLREVDPHGNPNVDRLWLLLRDAELMRLNIKNMGYNLALALGTGRMSGIPTHPPGENLGWRPSTQADIESAWCAYWCHQLGIRPLYHRKVWELCYVLQTLHASGMLQPSRRGIGFGCGEEPISSYLASRSVDVVSTDLPPDHDGAKGWRDTSQHGSTRDKLWHPRLVAREHFDRHVTLQHVDMNQIPDTLRHFDFCWSICSLEHLGTIEKGLTFVQNALHVLKPGGVAIHTTELNLRDGATIDNWPTVLFQRHHFERLARELQSAGHKLGTISFDTGSEALDRFIDLPPYFDLPDGMANLEKFPAHLKLSIDGFPSTCFGLVIQKA